MTFSIKLFEVVSVSAAIALAAAGGAGASTITSDFNFRSTGPAGQVTDQASKNFDGTNGLKAHVEGAYYFTKPTTVGDTFVGHSGGSYIGDGTVDVENNSWGLISCNQAEPGGTGTSCTQPEHAIDSIVSPKAGTFEGFEAMVFSFFDTAVSQPLVVSLTDVLFGWSTGTGLFDLFVDNKFVGAFHDYDDLTGLGLTGTTFVIGASSSTVLEPYSYWAYSCPGDTSTRRSGSHFFSTQTKKKCTGYKEVVKDSAFKLAGLSISYTSNPPPSVPLPAGGVLLLTGLGGLGLLRRQRRA